MADANWENSEYNVDLIFKNKDFFSDCNLSQLQDLVSWKSQEFTLLKVQIQVQWLFPLHETV